MGVNKIILVGNLGADPEVKQFDSGKSVTEFSLATSETYKDRDGQKQTRTEWHRIKAWDRLGEICAQYLNKGQQVYIEGRIQTRKWQDKDGNDKYTTEIVANQMQMLGSKGDVTESVPEPGEIVPLNTTGNIVGPVPDDDDLPF